MASLRSSINLIDNVSRTLNRITGNSDKMTRSIENSQRQMNKRTDFAKNLSRNEQKLELLGAQYAHQAREVQRLSNEYQRAIEIKGRYHDATQKIEGRLLSAQAAEIRLADAVEKAGKAFEQQHNEMKRNIDSSGSLTNKLQTLVGTYLSFRAAKRVLRDTVGAAGELNQRVGVMQAAFGDADIGKHYFNRLQIFAIDARKDIEELTDVTKNFMQVTRNTDKLMGLTKGANRFAMRTGSIGSAESIMQEAMRGEYSRLQRSLHLTDSQIEPLKRAVQRGSLDGIISAFDQAFNTAGLTDEIQKAYQDNPLQKFYKMLDRTQLGMARAGEEALLRLEPVLDKINNWLQSSNSDQFFGGIAAGITLIIDSINWLTNIVTSNWDIIQPMLLAIATIYLMSITRQLWGMIAPLKANTLEWFKMNLPILLIAAAVFIFIKILMQAGVTADQITGFIGGVFGVLFALLYNGVGFVWNTFANFAEFLVNLFIDPTYAIKMLFYNLAMDVLGFFNGLFNGIVSGLNWVIDKMNKYLKTDIGTVELKFMDNAISALERNRPTSDKNVWEATRMEYKDLAIEATKGYNFGASLPDRFSTGLSSIEDAISNFGKQEDIWNSMQNDTLGSLDKTTKKSVDKSEEDLKWMRDLAEQEVINRFATAT
ncbi:MAG: hypothetical protein GX053_14495 [Tissierella sp.]|nr:hypothetical protein [Tissierella sp.]